jgi:hypothetical protein
MQRQFCAPTSLLCITFLLSYAQDCVDAFSVPGSFAKSHSAHVLQLRAAGLVADRTFTANYLRKHRYVQQAHFRMGADAASSDKPADVLTHFLHVTDKYKEGSRVYRRTVYTHADW